MKETKISSFIPNAGNLRDGSNGIALNKMGGERSGGGSGEGGGGGGRKDDGIVCMICYEARGRSGKGFFASKCGHIGCESCWDKCLEVKLECPMCKMRTRKPNLIRLYDE